MQFDLARWRAVVVGFAQRMQVRIGEDSAAVVAQAHARVVQARRHLVRQHGIAHAAFRGVGVLDLNHAALAGP
ncbi:hypothetical protein D3C73_1413400 [compost metagenome]